MLALEQEAYELAGQPFNLGSPSRSARSCSASSACRSGKKTAERRAAHRRGGAGEAGRGLSAAGQAARAPRPVQAEGHLHRQAAADGQPARPAACTRTYAQAVAVTGRLSSNDPNLQNIPIRTAEGRRVREAFIAPPGQRRSVAPTTRRSSCASWPTSVGDAGLLRAFGDGIDVHRATASRGVRRARSTRSRSEQRRYAKVINFGLIYGMSAFGLAQQPGHRAQRRHAPTSSATSRAIRASSATWTRRAPAADEQGYVETLFGRRVVPARDQAAATGRAARRRAAGDQRADAGHRGRPDQAGDDRGAGGARRASAGDADDHAGARRTGVRGARRPSSTGRARRCRGSWPASPTLAVPLLAEVGVGPNWDEAH